MTEDYSYFEALSPRQQLNDLMHKYAQINRLHYGDSWRELERRYKEKYKKKLSLMRWQYCQENKAKVSMPEFLELSGRMDQALEIGHEMTGYILRGRFK